MAVARRVGSATSHSCEKSRLERSGWFPDVAEAEALQHACRDASCASAGDGSHAWRDHCRCEPPRPLTSLRKPGRAGSRGVQSLCLASYETKQVLRLDQNVKLSVLAHRFVPSILPVRLLLKPWILRILGPARRADRATGSAFIAKVTKHRRPRSWRHRLRDVRAPHTIVDRRRRPAP